MPAITVIIAVNLDINSAVTIESPYIASTKVIKFKYIKLNIKFGSIYSYNFNTIQTFF